MLVLLLKPGIQRYLVNRAMISCTNEAIPGTNPSLTGMPIVGSLRFKSQNIQKMLGTKTIKRCRSDLSRCKMHPTSLTFNHWTLMATPSNLLLVNMGNLHPLSKPICPACLHTFLPIFRVVQLSNPGHNIPKVFIFRPQDLPTC